MLSRLDNSRCSTLPLYLDSHHPSQLSSSRSSHVSSSLHRDANDRIGRTPRTLLQAWGRGMPPAAPHPCRRRLIRQLENDHADGWVGQGIRTLGLPVTNRRSTRPSHFDADVYGPFRAQLLSALGYLLPNQSRMSVFSKKVGRGFHAG